MELDKVIVHQLDLLQLWVLESGELESLEDLHSRADTIKQAINTLILPPQREIRRVKQDGYGTGWPLPESSATHYSLGYNRAIDQSSENLWGKKT